jgi:hypothetical protein
VSVSVALDELAHQVERFGAWPYLITVGAEGRPHAVSVEVTWSAAAGHFTAAGGRSTSRNATARPHAVTLLWAPYEPGGYSLIVDVKAATTDDGTFTLTPTTAVLHRTGPTPGEAPAGSCGSDCVRI